jgi:hypothetical protein
MFVNTVKELHFRYVVASEDFLAHDQTKLGLLFIGERKRTMWRSRPICSYYPDCMNPGASQLEQIGEVGDIEWHFAFGLSKFLQEHELRVPGLQGNPLVVSERVFGGMGNRSYDGISCSCFLNN